MDCVAKASFTLLPLFMDVGSVGRLLQKEKLCFLEEVQIKVSVTNIHINVVSYYDQDVRFDTGDLSCHQMPVFLARKVSCVQQLQRKERDNN